MGGFTLSQAEIDAAFASVTAHNTALEAAATFSGNLGGKTLSNFGANVSTQTANYTLVAADSGSTIRMDSTSALTLTLPASLPVGFVVAIVQSNTAQTTFSPASGATLANRQSYTKTAGQYALCSLEVTTNVGGSAAKYVLAGDGA